MVAHLVVRLAGIGPSMGSSMGLRGLAPLFARFRVIATLALMSAALGACSVASSQGSGPHPADPQARVPAANYRAVTGGYTSQRPVEPLPWRERNERVTPQGVTPQGVTPQDQPGGHDAHR